MKKLAVMFAGQGSQYPGMGLSFCDGSVHKNLIRDASSILGYDLAEALSGHIGDMHQTRYTQPLVLMASLLAYETFTSLGVQIDGMTGFSLGEYSALYASGIYSFKDIVHLVKMRAEFMDAAAQVMPGTMAAILGLDRDTVETVVEEASKEGVVVIANINSPQQMVISGEPKAIEKAIELSKAKGAKRAIKLNVSGAFHSPLMKPAGDRFHEVIKQMPYQAPNVPLYLNTTAQPLIIDALHQRMYEQLQSPVEFVKTIERMHQDGFTHFIEIGPGTVLSGLVRKINPDVEISHLDKKEDFEPLKGWLKTYGFIE